MSEAERDRVRDGMVDAQRRICRLVNDPVDGRAADVGVRRHWLLADVVAPDGNLDRVGLLERGKIRGRVSAVKCKVERRREDVVSDQTGFETRRSAGRRPLRLASQMKRQKTRLGTYDARPINRNVGNTTRRQV